ncbi:MAG: hypothetical protein HRT87_01705 [Legionellales bacterium]|nr:hypothetical protein [Legionellales bacterium]
MKKILVKSVLVLVGLGLSLSSSSVQTIDMNSSNMLGIVTVPSGAKNTASGDTVRITLSALQGRKNLKIAVNSSKTDPNGNCGMIWFGSDYTWDGGSVNKFSNMQSEIRLYNSKNQHIRTESLNRFFKTNVGNASFNVDEENISYIEMDFSSVKLHPVVTHITLNLDEIATNNVNSNNSQDDNKEDECLIM